MSEESPDLLFSKEESQKLKRFFDLLLLREYGVYVLFGSKPLVTAWVSLASDEESQAYYDNLTEEQKKMVFPAENINWADWEAVKDRIPLNNYVLFKRKTPDPLVDEIVFANRQNIIVELTTDYRLFKNIVGYDFSPEKVVFELEDPSSKFWNTIFSYKLSYGLICGYGKINSYFFQWWIAGRNARNPQIANFWENTPFGPKESKKFIEFQENPSYENVLIPPFRSVENDQVARRYERERKKIIALYKNKNPLAVTLKKLTSSKNISKISQ